MQTNYTFNMLVFTEDLCDGTFTRINHIIWKKNDKQFWIYYIQHILFFTHYIDAKSIICHNFDKQTRGIYSTLLTMLSVLIGK